MRTKVWSGGVRLLHGSLAAGVMGAFITHEAGGRVHEWLGYLALASAVLRVLWGLLPMPEHGPGRWVRFRQFVRGPRETLAYLSRLLAGREPRSLGHNPLGAWMIVALLGLTLLTSLSGWLFTTDAFWGTAWLEELHEALGEAFVPLVLLHWAGVAYASYRHRENLAAAMVHGYKELGPSDHESLR